MSKAKIALIIAAVLAVIVIGYFIYRSMTKLKDVKSSNEVIERANQEIVTSDLTLTNVQLGTICQKLYDAMEGLGTDTNAVYSAFAQANTRSDVLAIIATFGVRDGETLAEWLYGDLSGSEIMHLNSVIASKGINYNF